MPLDSGCMSHWNLKIATRTSTWVCEHKAVFSVLVFQNARMECHFKAPRDDEISRSQASFSDTTRPKLSRMERVLRYV
jgi:hypothetical protein